MTQEMKKAYMSEMSRCFRAETCYLIDDKHGWMHCNDSLIHPQFKNCFSIRHRLNSIPDMWIIPEHYMYKRLVAWRTHAALSYLANEENGTVLRHEKFHQFAEDMVDSKFYSKKSHIVTLISAHWGNRDHDVGYVVWKANPSGTNVTIVDKFLIQEVCAIRNIKMRWLEDLIISSIREMFTKSRIIYNKMLKKERPDCEVENSPTEVTCSLITQEKILKYLVDFAAECASKKAATDKKDPIEFPFTTAKMKMGEFEARADMLKFDSSAKTAFVIKCMNAWLKEAGFNDWKAKEIVEFTKYYDPEAEKLIECSTYSRVCVVHDEECAMFKKMPIRKMGLTQFLRDAMHTLPPERTAMMIRDLNKILKIDLTTKK